MTAPRPARAALLVARFSLRESLRRRVFVVVGLLTLVFLALYGLAAWQAFETSDELSGPSTAGVDADIVVGATLAGLAMFAILFLGAILAVFLTLGAVRGDAERGYIQPLLVRPLARRTLLLGRWLGATAACAPYVVVVTLAAFGLTAAFGGWWPDRVVTPLAALALGVAIIAALSLAGSIAFAATANGIAVFMLFGAGLTAGLLGQIAEAIGSDNLETVARIATWALPFEALYPGGPERAHGRHRRVRAPGHRPRPVRRRAVRRRRAVVVLAALPGRGRRRRGRGVQPPRPMSGRPGCCRSSAAAHRARPRPGRAPARRPAA